MEEKPEPTKADELSLMVRAAAWTWKRSSPSVKSKMSLFKLRWLHTHTHTHTRTNTHTSWTRLKYPESGVILPAHNRLHIEAPPHAFWCGPRGKQQKYIPVLSWYFAGSGYQYSGCTSNYEPRWIFYQLFMQLLKYELVITALFTQTVQTIGSIVNYCNGTGWVGGRMEEGGAEYPIFIASPVSNVQWASTLRALIDEGVSRLAHLPSLSFYLWLNQQPE